MAKAALAASRAVEVIRHLTAHPELSFTLTELSAALGVSPASMSAVLRSLSETGFLTRDRRRAYALGPALVAAGHAAHLRHPFIEAARPEMRRLAEFGTECVSTVPTGREHIILAIEGEPRGTSRETWVGQSVPLIPPYGQIFFAWADQRQIDDWINSSREAAEFREQLLSSLVTVRRLGITVGLHTPATEELTRMITMLAGGGAATQASRRQLAGQIAKQADSYLLREIVLDRIYNVANLVGPVFDAEGIVIFSLTIFGVGKVSGDRLLELRREMLDSCRRITHLIRGRWPGFAEDVSGALDAPETRSHIA